MVVLAVPVGLLVGLIMGSLGGGGAVLTVPILVYAFQLTPHDATTASLIIVGAGALAGSLAHGRAGRVRWREGLVFGVIGAPAAWGGSLLAARIDPDLLLLAFAGLLVAVSLLMMRRRPPAPDDAEQVRNLPALFGSALLIGALTGFFGVGGGFAVVPALVLLLGFWMPVATGTSLLVILINSLVALGSRAGEGLHLDWPLVGTFAAAAVVGNLLGGRVAGRVRSESLQRAFALLLLTVAVYVGVRAGLGLADN